VHPAVGTYRGRETDFEEMSCGKRKISNEGLIIAERMSIESVGFSCEDDSLCFDPSALHNTVREEEEAQEEFFRDTASY
jgi:hypothetical protein